MTPDKRQKTIERIRALRALALNNPSKEEAAAAMEMADKLMAQYELAEADIVPPRAIRRSVDRVVVTPPAEWGNNLADILRRVAVHVGLRYTEHKFGVDIKKTAKQIYEDLLKKCETDEEREQLSKTYKEATKWIL